MSQFIPVINFLPLIPALRNPTTSPHRSFVCFFPTRPYPFLRGCSSAILTVVSASCLPTLTIAGFYTFLVPISFRVPHPSSFFFGLTRICTSGVACTPLPPQAIVCIALHFTSISFVIHLPSIFPPFLLSHVVFEDEDGLLGWFTLFIGSLMCCFSARLPSWISFLLAAVQEQCEMNTISRSYLV